MNENTTPTLSTAKVHIYSDIDLCFLNTFLKKMILNKEMLFCDKPRFTYCVTFIIYLIIKMLYICMKIK